MYEEKTQEEQAVILGVATEKDINTLINIK